MQQKHLNNLGLVAIIFCFGWFSYYFMKEHGYEKDLIQKERRMQFLRDSLQAEESRLNIEIMRDAFDVKSDTASMPPLQSEK